MPSALALPRLAALPSIAFFRDLFFPRLYLLDQIQGPKLNLDVHWPLDEHDLIFDPLLVEQQGIVLLTLVVLELLLKRDQAPPACA